MLMSIHVFKLKKLGNYCYRVKIYGLLHGCKLDDSAVTIHEYKTLFEVESKIKSLKGRFKNELIMVTNIIPLK